jgi:hypothetical protein
MNFYEFINTIYGTVKLKLRVSPHALIWYCVDPQYSLLHGVTTSNLERLRINVGPSNNTVEVGCEVPILKQCADNLSKKSVHDVYTKIFTQLNSYGNTCNNILAGGESEVTELTNNLVKFYSYGHTNLTLTCANLEVIQAESIIAGYNITDLIITVLKKILKKRPLAVLVERYEINHFSGLFNSSDIIVQNSFPFPLINSKVLAVLFPQKLVILLVLQILTSNDFI